MFLLNQIKASRKLYLLVCVLSVFILVIGLYGIYQLKNIHQTTQTLYKDRVFPIVQLTDVRLSYVVNILSTAQQAKNKEITFEEANKRIVEAEKMINNNWSAYKLTYFTPEEKKLVSEVEILMAETDNSIEKLKVILIQEDAKALDDFIKQGFSVTINQFITKLNKLIDLQVSIAGKVYERSENVFRMTSERFCVLIILCLFFAIFFSYYIVRNVKDMFTSIRESEKKYRAIFENFQDIFYQATLSGTIIEISPSVEKITDYNREELIGTQTVDLYYDPSEREKTIQLLQEGALKEYELKLKSKSGGLVYGLLTSSIIMNDKGMPSHIDGVFRSINKRKQTEARLKEAQAIANMGNWDIDMVNNIHTWSDEIYKIYGIDKEEVQPSIEALLSFMHPDDLTAEEEKVKETFEFFKDSSSHFRFIRKDGLTRFGYIEWRFEFNQNNQPIRIYGILQDITERKRTEHEREKMITDILQRNKNFEQFSYIVSHNLRGPVANILGIANALKSNNCEIERMELQEVLSQSTKQLDEVIKAMNEILKIRNENTHSKEPISFSELINDIESGLPNLTQRNEVEITTDFSVDSITTIRGALRNIFYNLISNSIKYRQHGKTSCIYIKNEVHNDKIRISFKDNGMGIDIEKYGGKIFGLSQRFHPDIEGKGIGLFMVRAQVELLGGTISIKSELEVGTEFIIDLPMN